MWCSAADGRAQLYRKFLNNVPVVVLGKAYCGLMFAYGRICHRKEKTGAGSACLKGSGKGVQKTACEVNISTAMCVNIYINFL